MRSKHILLTILIWALLFFSGYYNYARLFSNHSDSAFNVSNSISSVDGDKLAHFDTIGQLIIKGAEYFFKAQADINILSEKVELSDLYSVDYYSMLKTVNIAMDNMNMAQYYYQELQYIANGTLYNPTVIDKLVTFDYDSFQEQNNLIKDIFSEVKGYLKNGSVRGIYSHTSSYFDTLTNTLETIKRELHSGEVPSNIHMWNLNQTCARAHMFGQYAAMIFYAL